ncbi:MAG TPA: alanine racemase [Terriglobia bacterium]|nr:alanine racemase [Terriglobia bacterium]
MKYHELPTPALTIDLDILECNLDRMAAYCRQHGIGLRPHTKTHKVPEVARMQVERGTVGLTVAKVGEAEVMAGAGLDKILIAFPIWGEEKLRRIAAIARERDILLSLDNEATAEGLSQAASAAAATVGVLVEFDVGMRRCGVEAGPAALELARKISKMPGLKFRGLMLYPGNIWGMEAGRKQIAKQVADRVEMTLEPFRKAGMEVEIISGGSTPSAFLTDQIPGVTEIRPGTYVYNDLNTFYQGACRLEDCAARVVATVISTAVPDRAMIDAGSKTLSADALGSGPARGHGYVVEAPDAPLIKLNEEHGHLDITNSTRKFQVGEVVTVIPNHVCTCVNMHDEVFLVRKGQVEGSWKVAGRGKVR